MLSHSLIRDINDKAIILKTREDIMSFTKTDTAYSYRLYLMKTGEWYSLHANPYGDERDDLAITHMEIYTRDSPLARPATVYEQGTIRDFYLKKVHNDNFILFTYRDHQIWYGYNDSASKGCYFVTDLDGNELANVDQIRDARFFIDQSFEGVQDDEK